MEGIVSSHVCRKSITVSSPRWLVTLITPPRGWTWHELVQNSSLDLQIEPDIQGEKEQKAKTKIRTKTPKTKNKNKIFSSRVIDLEGYKPSAVSGRFLWWWEIPSAIGKDVANTRDRCREKQRDKAGGREGGKDGERGWERERGKERIEFLDLVPEPSLICFN